MIDVSVSSEEISNGEGCAALCMITYQAVNKLPQSGTLIHQVLGRIQELTMSQVRPVLKCP